MSCLCVLLLLLGRAAGEDPPAKPAEKSQPAYLAEFDKLKAEMNKVRLHRPFCQLGPASFFVHIK